MNEETLEKIILSNHTPAYIFDINTLKSRIEYLRTKLPPEILLCYAIKANTFVVKDIENYIDRFEVCSPGEYEICKESNVSDKKVLISGVYKSKEFIDNMIKERKDINVYTIESMEQFEIFKNVKTENRVRLMLRLTSGNQFGINEDEIESIIRNRLDYENIDIIGIQYFSGTQKKSLKNLKKEVDYIDDFVRKLYDKYEYIAKEIEFGPGFPVHYFKVDEFDEDNFLNEFSQIIGNMKFKGKIVLELGRSISASCGTYITKVVDIKTNKNENYAILDGGIHHLVYYGQFMAMKIPKCDIYPKREGREQNWNLCGSLCTINDILVKQFPISNLKIGDIFVFKNTGAYCMTEGISLFLSRNLPKIIKIKEDKSIEIIREHIPTYKFNM